MFISIKTHGLFYIRCLKITHFTLAQLLNLFAASIDDNFQSSDSCNDVVHINIKFFAYSERFIQLLALRNVHSVLPFSSILYFLILYTQFRWLYICFFKHIPRIYIRIHNELCMMMNAERRRFFYFKKFGSMSRHLFSASLLNKV